MAKSAPFHFRVSGVKVHDYGPQTQAYTASMINSTADRTTLYTRICTFVPYA